MSETMPELSGTIDLPPFRERWPWRGAHLQTVRNTLRRPRFRLAAGERLRFPMADGSGDVLLGLLNRPGRPVAGRPLAVLIHGLTGCETGSYMQATAMALLAAGCPVLRLNLRGAGPSRDLCRLRYHAGRTQDLREVLAQLPPELSANGVVMAGYSLGGNALLKLLGEGDLPVPVRAAASISAPIDLHRSSLAFLEPRNRLYHRWLLARMKEESLAPCPGLEPRWIDAIRHSRSVWDFDDLFVAPWNGWSGAEEYYRVNSAAGFLEAIRVPTLVIHALDDPWIPGDCYRAVAWERNPSLHPLLPAGGGHVGFHAPGGVWHDRCLTAFFARHAG